MRQEERQETEDAKIAYGRCNNNNITPPSTPTKRNRKMSIFNRGNNRRRSSKDAEVVPVVSTKNSIINKNYALLEEDDDEKFKRKQQRRRQAQHQRCSSSPSELTETDVSGLSGAAPPLSPKSPSNRALSPSSLNNSGGSNKKNLLLNSEYKLKNRSSSYNSILCVLKRQSTAPTTINNSSTGNNSSSQRRRQLRQKSSTTLPFIPSLAKTNNSPLGHSNTSGSRRRSSHAVKILQVPISSDECSDLTTVFSHNTDDDNDNKNDNIKGVEKNKKNRWKKRRRKQDTTETATIATAKSCENCNDNNNNNDEYWWSGVDEIDLNGNIIVVAADVVPPPNPQQKQQQQQQQQNGDDDNISNTTVADENRNSLVITPSSVERVRQQQQGEGVKTSSTDMATATTTKNDSTRERDKSPQLSPPPPTTVKQTSTDDGVMVDLDTKTTVDDNDDDDDDDGNLTDGEGTQQTKETWSLKTNYTPAWPFFATTPIKAAGNTTNENEDEDDEDDDGFTWGSLYTKGGDESSDSSDTGEKDFDQLLGTLKVVDNNNNNGYDNGAYDNDDVDSAMPFVEVFEIQEIETVWSTTTTTEIILEDDDVLLYENDNVKVVYTEDYYTTEPLYEVVHVENHEHNDHPVVDVKKEENTTTTTAGVEESRKNKAHPNHLTNDKTKKDKKSNSAQHHKSTTATKKKTKTNDNNSNTKSLTTGAKQQKQKKQKQFSSHHKATTKTTLIVSDNNNANNKNNSNNEHDSSMPTMTSPPPATIDELLKEVIIKEKEVGINENIASMYTKIGDLYSKASDGKNTYDEALRSYSEVLRIQGLLLQKRQVEGHCTKSIKASLVIEMAKTYNTIGRLNLKNGKCYYAMDNHQRAYELLTNTFVGGGGGSAGNAIISNSSSLSRTSSNENTTTTNSNTSAATKHPLVLRTLIYIGNVYYRMRNSLSTIRSCNDPFSEHYKTNMLNLIANAHVYFGHYRMAIGFLEEKLILLSPNDTTTGNSFRNGNMVKVHKQSSFCCEYNKEKMNVLLCLGFLCIKAGYYPEALDYHDLAVQLITEINLFQSTKDEQQESNKVNIARARILKGSSMFHLGNFDEAKFLFHGALEILQGLVSKHTSNNKNTHVVALFGVGTTNNNNEKHYIINSIDINEMIAKTWRLLGVLQCELYEYDDAIKSFDIALTIQQRIVYTSSNNKSHLDHPEILLTRLQICKLRSNLYQLDESLIEELNDILEQQMKVHHSKRHPYISDTYECIGQFYERKSDFQEALRNFEHCFFIREKFLGIDHPMIAQVLHHIATIRACEGKHGVSLRVLTNVLSIRKESLGDEHIDVARAMSSKGRSLLHLGKVKEAVECFNESLRITDQLRRITDQLRSSSPSLSRQQRQHHNNNNFYHHPAVAEINTNLALLHLRKCQYDRASTHLYESLRIYQSFKQLPQNYPLIIDAKKMLERVDSEELRFV